MRLHAYLALRKSGDLDMRNDFSEHGELDATQRIKGGWVLGRRTANAYDYDPHDSAWMCLCSPPG